MPPSQQNQYDFIMNGNPKPSRGPLFGNNLVARIAIIAVGLIVLVIIGAVVNSFLNKGSEAQTQRLIEVVQTQSEIIRVSALAKDKSRDINTVNFALNTRMSVQSSQQEIKKSLAGRGVNEKSISKQLAAGKNPKTDAALDEATKNSRFDETFITILNKQLADYQTLLKAAYDGGKPSERTALNASFENAALLAKKSETQATQ